MPVRVATVEDAPAAAALLDAFNREFDAPTPGPERLAARLGRLIARGDTDAFLVEEPPVGIALVTYRSNVWSDGPVALLDELYVRPGLRGRGLGSALIAAVVDAATARGTALVEVNVDEGDVDALRFYARHGFALDQPDTGERAFYMSRAVTTGPD